MGRYYNGDIEGKFYFAIQSSMDAEHFGGKHHLTGIEEVCFEFCEEDLQDIKIGISRCREILGDYELRIKKYFEETESHSEKMLIEYLSMNEENVKDLMINYVRLDLGLKILKCVEERGSCNFIGEL